MPNLFGRREESRGRRGDNSERRGPEAESFEEEDEDAEERWSEDEREHEERADEEHDQPVHFHKGRGGRNGGQQKQRGPREPRLPGHEAVGLAREYILQLTGQEPETVSGLDSSAGRWKVVLDVLELERVPRSTDVLASYEIELDEQGELIGYRRLGRYYRNQVERG